MLDSDLKNDLDTPPGQVSNIDSPTRRTLVKYAWATPAVISLGGISSFGGGISGGHGRKRGGGRGHGKGHGRGHGHGSGKRTR